MDFDIEGEQFANAFFTTEKKIGKCIIPHTSKKKKKTGK